MMKNLLTRLKEFTPYAPAASQYLGLGMIVGGLWVLAGFGWALLAAGVITTAIGAGKEAGVI